MRSGPAYQHHQETAVRTVAVEAQQHVQRLAGFFSHETTGESMYALVAAPSKISVANTTVHDMLCMPTPRNGCHYQAVKMVYAFLNKIVTMDW